MIRARDMRLAAAPGIGEDRAGRRDLQLVAFAGLAAFAALRWASLLTDPPVLRALLAAVVIVAGAAGLVRLRRGHLSRPATLLASTAIALAAFALAIVAVGVPVRLLSPLHWGDLASQVSGAIGTVRNADYPYTGGDAWSRLVIMLGLPLLLGLAGALAFWPSREFSPARRVAALALIVVAYGIAVTLSPPQDKLFNGLVLFVLVSAWLWLPRLPRRGLPAGGMALAIAGLLALPVSDGLDGARPLFNYRGWTTTAKTQTDFFNWNQTYGPIDWPRTARTMLDVHSGRGHYWRAAVLDRFDGFRWLMSDENSAAPLELPTQVEPNRYSILNQNWKHKITFDVKSLSSPLVVGAGTIISVLGIHDTVATANGVVLPGNESLGNGDRYTVVAYTPQPTTRQMIRSPRGYPPSLRRYTTINVPVGVVHTVPPPPKPGAKPKVPGVIATIEPLEFPLRGSGAGVRPASAEAISAAPSAQAQRFLKLPLSRRIGIEINRSPYERMYRLAHRITAGSPTSYAAVTAIEGYLKGKFTYNEAPPRRTFPLSAFLFRDRIGYCQQFSGAMALMLRMVGIPARVASGFSPGEPTKNGFVVRELDAHAWVEVYFRGIGWVPFDPTPAASPAASRSPVGGTTAPVITRREGPKIGTGLTVRGALPSPQGGGGGFPFWVPALVLLALGAAAGAVIMLRGARARSLAPGQRLDLYLQEFEAALRRLRPPIASGTTLLALERELRTRRSAAAADYAARLRADRFAPHPTGLPSPAERRRLRLALTAGRGLRRRLQGLRLLPPGGPLA